MRAFLALDLPETLTYEIARLQAGLSVGRPVPEENLHLTLAFLAELEEARLMDVAEALAGIRAKPVTFELAGLDLFGGKRPGVLVLTARGQGLDPLHAKVMRALRDAGADPGRERFRPHVTIARLPRDMGPRDQQRLGEFLALNGRAAFPPVTCAGLTLYRSHLKPDGPLYEPLAEFDLTG